jgi:hypothetical protein
MQPRFTFIKHIEEVNKFDTYSLTMESSSVTLTELLLDFEAFLKGCGYVFSGELTLVEEETADAEDN